MSNTTGMYRRSSQVIRSWHIRSIGEPAGQHQRLRWIHRCEIKAIRHPGSLRLTESMFDEFPPDAVESDGVACVMSFA
jgi:hypothetical protein